MALSKEILQPDGVITNYHRILFIQITTNQHNSIVVLSYPNDNIREKEKECVIEGPYRQSVTYMTDYSPSMTVETAYEYLKTLPQFEGATDI